VGMVGTKTIIFSGSKRCFNAINESAGILDDFLADILSGNIAVHRS